MLAFVALILAAATEPSPQFSRCMRQAGSVSADMLECGATEIARVDRRLNAAYRDLMTKLPLHEKSRLRIEQRRWLNHHLRETHTLAADPNDGSMAFIASQRFELQDLGDRVAALEARLAKLR